VAYAAKKSRIFRNEDTMTETPNAPEPDTQDPDATEPTDPETPDESETDNGEERGSDGE
jgi:hypothetical protein